MINSMSCKSLKCTFCCLNTTFSHIFAFGPGSIRLENAVGIQPVQHSGPKLVSQLNWTGKYYCICVRCLYNCKYCLGVTMYLVKVRCMTPLADDIKGYIVVALKISHIRGTSFVGYWCSLYKYCLLYTSDAADE